ncbi:MAG: serine--tRNA ligase [Dehalococcoidia bacterium]|nr:serine--tRNA ligase [Dehalococcoidia bacterium]
MLDIKFIIENKEECKNKLLMRGEKLDVDNLEKLFEKRKKLILKTEEISTIRNKTSKDIGISKGKPPQELIQKMKSFGLELSEKLKKLKAVEDELNDQLLRLPNLPLDDTLVGDSEQDNVVLETFNMDKKKSKSIPHWDLGEKLKIIDMEKGTKLTGARWYVLTGKGAMLQRALVQWMLNHHVFSNHYTEIAPPFLVNRKTMIGSGNLPKFEETLFSDSKNDLWLIPTGEVSLNSLYYGDIINEDLPLKYVTHTPCFRDEKSSAGRDTRGIKRVHQFEKVELYRYEHPLNSMKAFDEMVKEVCELCELLGFTYRIVELCTGDMGFQSAKTFDIEVWSPGCEEWLEVSSISTCTDFQSRRTNTRFKDLIDSKTKLPHTLNGSGLAIPRVIIAILENYLDKDGVVEIPEILHEYTNFKTIS